MHIDSKSYGVSPVCNPRPIQLYDILPLIPGEALEFSRLDMASYPPRTILLIHPIVQAITTEYQKRKDGMKWWPEQEGEAILGGSSWARIVPKRASGKKARKAILAELEAGE